MGRDNIARGLALQAPAHPGYISGNWYALFPNASAAGGAALAASTIRAVPFVIAKPLRISDLGVRLTTISAAGNFQLAVYAHSATTGRPTGSALCSTGSISTGVAGALSGSVTPVQLAPGTYWFALNQDNAVAAYQAITSAFVMGYVAGSATLGNITSLTSGGVLSQTVAQAFGTWPDLTSASLTENTTNLTAIAGFAKAA